MKHSIIIVLLLFSSFSFAQKDKIVFKETTCDTGKERAIEDANHGIYKYITYGMVASTDWGFDTFYWQYVKDEYNVILGTGGCVVKPDIMCYTSKMKELIRRDFKDDFFERSKQEAKRLYKKKVK